MTGEATGGTQSCYYTHLKLAAQVPTVHCPHATGRAPCHDNSQPAPGCDSSPCQNGGGCSGDPDGTWVCICAAGFEGESCAAAVTGGECASGPCLNGGMCGDSTTPATSTPPGVRFNHASASSQARPRTRSLN